MIIKKILRCIIFWLIIFPTLIWCFFCGIIFLLFPLWLITDDKIEEIGAFKEFKNIILKWGLMKGYINDI